MSAVLDNAIHKLRWSCGTEWSASVSPKECEAILDERDGLYATITFLQARLREATGGAVSQLPASDDRGVGVTRPVALRATSEPSSEYLDDAGWGVAV